jgi:hypothetical protein
MGLAILERHWMAEELVDVAQRRNRYAGDAWTQKR